MEHITPLELLHERLSIYEKALRKSNENFESGKIPETENQTHKKNNEPLIQEYKYAIQILTSNTFTYGKAEEYSKRNGSSR